MFLSDGARGQYEKTILALVQDERDRQQRKWGIQTHSIPEWMTILGEEFGEACKAGLETEYRNAPLKDLEKENARLKRIVADQAPTTSPRLPWTFQSSAFLATRS